MRDSIHVLFCKCAKFHVIPLMGSIDLWILSQAHIFKMAENIDFFTFNFLRPIRNEILWVGAAR